MNQHEFKVWFAAKDLGPLEDVRDMVELHALQNGRKDQFGPDFWESVKFTVEMYLDDPDLAGVFEGYRIVAKRN